MQDFQQTHEKIAINATSNIDNAITRFINERKRLIRAFANSNHDTFNALISSPNDDLLKDKLNHQFLNIFPSFIGFTLADTKGNILIDDFEGSNRSLDIKALKNFIQTGIYLPRVHQNTNKYHFDIITNIHNDAHVLLVAFNADILSSIIQIAEVPDHHFMLALKQKDQLLIEVTKNGSRQQMSNRHDFRLNDEEMRRILHKENIKNTAWQSIDLHSPDLYINFKQKMINNMLIIYFIFFTLLVSMTFFLRREEKLKQLAEQQRYDFIGVVSHELRTPLTSIKGSISLVTNGVTGEIPEKAKKMLDMALDNSNRLIELVNDLLDIQKIEAGKISLDKKPLNLTDLINLAINNIEAYGSNFSVTYQLLDLIPNTIILADEGRMLQVMNNLLSNAAKYGKQNDVVDISIIPYMNKVRISITDNGKGISVELQNNIFEKFSQGKNSASEKKINSTGLGLHIVKKIVNLHDGEINFYTSNTGTTFYIDFPIKQNNRL